MPISILEKKETRYAALCCIGFGIYMAIALLARNDSADITLTTHYLRTVVKGATCILFAILYFRLAISPRKLFLAAALSESIHIVCYYGLIGFHYQDYSSLYVISGIFDGIASGLVLMLFAMVVSQFSAAKARIVIVLAFLVGNLIFAASLFLPSLVVYWLRVAVIIGAFSLLAICLWRQLDSCKLVARNTTRKANSWNDFLAIENRRKRNGELSLSPLIALAAFFSTLYAFVAQICEEAALFRGLFDAESEMVCIAAIVLFLIIVSFHEHFPKVESFLIVLLPLFASVFLSVPFLWGREGLFVSGLLIKAFSTISTMLIWMLLVQTFETSTHFALLCVGLTQGLTQFFLIVGRAIGSKVYSAMIVDPSALSLATLAIVWALAMVFFFAWATHILKLPFFQKSGHGVVDDHFEESGRQPVDLFKAACDIVARDSHLSETEESVFREAARGRSIRWIADRFFVSESTVKTHLKHIYAKTSTNNKQELIELVEETSQRL